MVLHICVNRGDLHEELVDRLQAAILKIAEKNNLNLDIQVQDVGLYGAIDISNPAIIFGNFTKSQVNAENDTIKLFYLPDLGSLENKIENKQTRSDASRKIKEIIESLAKIKTTKKNEEKIIESYSVEKSNTSLGVGDNIDIHIPEDKIEYLLRIKKLLNSKKVIVQKGDIKIEFD